MAGEGSVMVTSEQTCEKDAKTYLPPCTACRRRMGGLTGQSCHWTGETWKTEP